MQPAIKFQTVEIQVLAGNTQPTFNFPPQPFLVGKKIVSIETFTNNDMTASPVYGNALPTTAQFKTLYLSLYGADPDSSYNAMPVATPGQQPAQGLWLRGIPFVSLHRTSNGTDPFVYDLLELEPRNIAWEQSTVTTKLAGGLNPGSNISIVLLVGYMGIENGQNQ